MNKKKKREYCGIDLSNMQVVIFKKPNLRKCIRDNGYGLTVIDRGIDISENIRLSKGFMPEFILGGGAETLFEWMLVSYRDDVSTLGFVAYLWRLEETNK